MSNKALVRAKKAKNDEFYTPMETVEAGINPHIKHFKGKTIYCNCDNPYYSNFFKYFAANFNRIGLKKLIATCYSRQPSLFNDEIPPLLKTPYKATITNVPEGTATDINTLKGLPGNSLEILKGDGDFRSPECLELLKQSDMICTNPSFSFFREFVNLCETNGKDFFIIGVTVASSYDNCFKMLQKGRLFFEPIKKTKGFIIPDNHAKKIGFCLIEDKGIKYTNISITSWFANFDFRINPVKIKPRKNVIYVPECYPQYDNVKAININTLEDIPSNYFDTMGVPITYLVKHNPDLFDIVGISKDVFINGKELYRRVFIKRRA